MYEYITHLLAGGLGNQLFQIFTTISIAKENNIIFFFSNKTFSNKTFSNKTNNIDLSKMKLDEEGNTIRKTYWNSFLMNLFPYLKIDSDKDSVDIIKYIIDEDNVNNMIDVNNNIILPQIHSTSGEYIEYNLEGYYQSPKFFDKNKNYILEITGIFNIIYLLKKSMNKTQLKTKENSISIHFRLGDYKSIPDCHPILNVSYYIESIEYILQNAKIKPKYVEYYCEEEDINIVVDMIEKIKFIFNDLEFIHNNNNSDWQQLIQMSLCKYNIIANSSFSWWGAYLNTNTDMIVCYPNIWFGPAIDKNVDDMFPENWKCISA